MAIAAGRGRRRDRMVLSSLATGALEDVAAAAPDGLRWMQVYVFRDRSVTADLVARAADAGYRALVLTVDAPVSGLRLREIREGVHLPDDLALPNLGDTSTRQARRGGFMAVVSSQFDPTLTYDDIGWLAEISGLPVVVKGVLRADDAVRCVEAGAAAVVVSNHGARQLDDGPATADVLAEVADAVGEPGRGLRRRRPPPAGRRRQGAGPGRPGRPPRPARDLVARHRRERRCRRAARAGSRPSCAARWPSAVPRPSPTSTARSSARRHEHRSVNTAP